MSSRTLFYLRTVSASPCSHLVSLCEHHSHACPSLPPSRGTRCYPPLSAGVAAVPDPLTGLVG